MRAMARKGAPFARPRATIRTCHRIENAQHLCPLCTSCMHGHDASPQSTQGKQHRGRDREPGESCPRLNHSQRGAHLGAQLGGGGQDDDAGGVAHSEAVAEALLLLAQRLHQRQQVRQRLAAPCTSQTTSACGIAPQHAPCILLDDCHICTDSLWHAMGIYKGKPLPTTMVRSEMLEEFAA